MLVDKFKRKQKIKKNPYGEVEAAILVKAADVPVQKKSRVEKEKDGEELDDDIEPEYHGQFVRRRALVDQMLMSNKKTDFSYADEKRVFHGENGAFSSVDLAAWFRLYNQTAIKKPLHTNLRTKSVIPGM